jgi:hypothetical protein
VRTYTGHRYSIHPHLQQVFHAVPWSSNTEWQKFD